MQFVEVLLKGVRIHCFPLDASTGDAYSVICFPREINFSIERGDCKP